MEIIADTHIHIYPVHDPAELIRRAARRLRRASSSPEAVLALFLAEGRGFDFFGRLRNGTHGLPGTFRVDSADEPEAFRVTLEEGEFVWILAGRQIAAVERVEILALTLAGGVEDGRPASETVEAVFARGGVPVLAWSPGKWMFRRAAVVRSLLRTFGPDRLLLGDTSLRPLGWPAPPAMGEPGRRVVAGSDPLPFAGEEVRAGCYGIALEGDFDELRPATSLRRLLVDPATPLRRIGRRDPPWRTAGRLFRHHFRKGGAE